MSGAQKETPARPRFACPVDGFQQMINGKYKLRILWALKLGPRRYGEIKKGLLRDISGSQQIAPIGQSLLPIIEPMVEWGRQYLARDVDFPTNEA